MIKSKDIKELLWFPVDLLQAIIFPSPSPEAMEQIIEYCLGKKQSDQYHQRAKWKEQYKKITSAYSPLKLESPESYDNQFYLPAQEITIFGRKIHIPAGEYEASLCQDKSHGSKCGIMQGSSKISPKSFESIASRCDDYSEFVHQIYDMKKWNKRDQQDINIGTTPFSTYFINESFPADATYVRKRYERHKQRLENTKNLLNAIEPYCDVRVIGITQRLSWKKGFYPPELENYKFRKE